MNAGPGLRVVYPYGTTRLCSIPRLPMRQVGRLPRNLMALVRWRRWAVAELRAALADWSQAP
ncbi:hypothetical protein [Streptomyces albireticuli]|uniref:hypothetical protein n=1 Tax=Streptomyces albireticuli TaxID=1940 RepID=UPI003688C8B2